ncbi:aspartoacylase-like isoform X2 [Lethenteron reissneri]|uniref:aspartoacylase-like isoform X2 n=1 Tax=Lethenteron reissneri TaxID=7753 RepID=UPI002AB5F07F|nr:aspartoacylase-like isoform X2 [Lethenteron reissneri]
MESVPPVSRVAIFGGTHGDEMSGVCLARHWLSDAGEAAAEISRPSFSSTPVVANPRAVQRCTRYIDTDLNRCFTHEQLAVEVKEDTPYETLRAQELNRLFGPKGSDQAFDFIIDMHNTTSNMGNCLIVSNSADILALHMARYMQDICKSAISPVFLNEMAGVERCYATSVSKHGIALELGPQPQGVARADVLIRMRKLVTTALDFLHLFNTGHEFPAGNLEVCRVTERIDYPRDSHGNLTAVIHPDLQDRDWEPLHPGKPVFLTLDGATIPYKGPSVTIPAFINEAAYYEKGLAFWATQREMLHFPALRVDGQASQAHI